MERGGQGGHTGTLRRHRHSADARAKPRGLRTGRRGARGPGVRPYVCGQRLRIGADPAQRPRQPRLLHCVLVQHLHLGADLHAAVVCRAADSGLVSRRPAGHAEPRHVPDRAPERSGHRADQPHGQTHERPSGDRGQRGRTRSGFRRRHISGFHARRCVGAGVAVGSDHRSQIAAAVGHGAMDPRSRRSPGAGCAPFSR